MTLIDIIDRRFLNKKSILDVYNCIVKINVSIKYIKRMYIAFTIL
jgi:hypothetical protein